MYWSWLVIRRLLEAGNLERGFGLEVRILLKLEYLNPAGSVKDRICESDDSGCQGAWPFTGRGGID